MIASAVDNTGVLKAAGGALNVERAVMGAGSGVIDGGTLAFGSSFTEDIAFTGASGILELAQSQAYTGQILGFSKSASTSLDLRDIGFTDAGEATFSGDAKSGVLSVTDGSHTAHITLIGDYTGVTFVASSDGHGGVSIVDSGAGAPSPHRLLAAMASLATADAGGIAREAWREPWRPLLAVSGRAHFA